MLSGLSGSWIYLLSDQIFTRVNNIKWIKKEIEILFEPKLSDCRGCPKLIMATRKMSCRYSRLCGSAFDAVDAVRSAIPKGFKF
jgi:hypothetical protein